VIRIRVTVDGGTIQTLLLPADEPEASIHVPVSAKLVLEVRDGSSGAPVEAFAWLRYMPGGELRALGRTIRGHIDVASGLGVGKYLVEVSHPQYAGWRSEELTVSGATGEHELLATLERRTDLCFVTIEVGNAARGPRDSRWLLVARRLDGSDAHNDEHVVVEKDGALAVGLPCSAHVKLLGVALDHLVGFVSDAVQAGRESQTIQPTLEATATFNPAEAWNRREVRALTATVDCFGTVTLVEGEREGEEPLPTSWLAKQPDRLGPFILGRTVLSASRTGHDSLVLPMDGR